MSIQATSHIWGDRSLNGIPLLVMLALSDSVQDNGECYTMLDSVAHLARLDIGECLNILDGLERSGHISFIAGNGKTRHTSDLKIVVNSIKAQYDSRPPRVKTQYELTIEEWNKIRRSVSPIVKARDNRQCVYCGSCENLSIDHRIPVLAGGTNDLENLVTACRSCNSSKNAKTPEEWQVQQNAVG